jgi:signal peptidase II
MYLGQEYHVSGNWALIHFTENEGMAFGWTLPGGYGKIMLSLFRILAVVGLSYLLFGVIRKKKDTIVWVALSLIIAGAIGNILDGTFYGLMFNESGLYCGNIAQLFPAGKGYAGLMHGKVVDMFYFPMLSGHFPSWFPAYANEPFVFFNYIFNLADASVSTGVGLVLLFHKKFFGAKEQNGSAFVSPL